MHDLGTTHSANPRPVDNIELRDYMAPPIMDGLDGIDKLGGGVDTCDGAAVVTPV
jgi:hypothetical protein